jgi:phospholipid transport system transporter-binding protein
MMLVLPSELMHAQANACLRMLVQGLRSQSGAAIIVDAAGLGRFDSSVLAVLLEFRRECLAAGKRLSVSGLPDRLCDVAGLYGIGELLSPA